MLDGPVQLFVVVVVPPDNVPPKERRKLKNISYQLPHQNLKFSFFFHAILLRYRQTDAYCIVLVLHYALVFSVNVGLMSYIHIDYFVFLAT